MQLYRLASPKSAGWASRLKSCSEELMLQSKSKGSQLAQFLLAQGRSVFLFHTGLQLIGQGPPILKSINL